MSKSFFEHLNQNLQALKSAGLYKSERIITSRQSANISVLPRNKVLNFCANNYLGLADNAQLIEAGKNALDKKGYGMASVRFICGTQDVHKELESKISAFLGMEDTILYSSCFDANTGLFETLLGAEDAIISDAMNHASIIDGVRLCKAQRFRYQNNDMADLEIRLKEASNARFRLIATDGVFSMDGIIANLQGICELAEKYDAMVMVDDSHAVGFMGENGRGTPEYCGVAGKVDILTGTLGKALGGATGGYTSAKKEIVEWLRQRSRPYLFSNTLAPVITVTTQTVLKLIDSRPELRKQLFENADFFRKEMTELGFTLAGARHPIIPVMLGDAELAQKFAAQMLKENIYVIGFSFPVVPQGQSRIRTQMSAAHSRKDVESAVQAFKKVGQQLRIIK
jgi:glycine C-acetyltransferase